MSAAVASRPRRIRWVLAAFAAASTVVGSRAVRAGDEVLRDDWQLISIGGSPSGYEHVVVRRVGTPTTIETTREVKISLRRLDSTIESSSRETTVEREDGALVSIHVRETASAVETVTSITFEGGTARVVTETMGTQREATASVPEDLVGPWRADRIPAEAGYPEGKTFESRVFLRELGGPQTLRTTVVGRETTESTGGAAGTLVRLQQSFGSLPVEGTLWVEPDGRLVKTRMVLAGVTIESRRATKEEALGGATSAPPADLFTASLLTSDVLVPHARRLDAARIRLRPTTAGEKLPDVSSDRQVVERREDDGAIVLRLRREVPASGAGARPLASVPKDLELYLAPSSSLQSDDPAIVEVAKAAVGGEKDAWKAAQAIEAWVAKNLTKKNMGVGFASALEVCKNREGDCTEHAVLVAAMCRAVGIPSRIAMGLEYLYGVWGGHAWSEVWVGGRWYALDATNGLGFVDPLHLTVVTSALAEGSFGQEMTNVLGIVGRVDVDVLEVTWKGRTLPVADPDAIRVEGRRYVNRLFDVAFEAPEGFAVEAVVPKGLETRLARATRKGSSGQELEILVTAEDLPVEGARKPSGAASSPVEVGGRAGELLTRKGALAARIVVDDVVFGFVATSEDPEAAAALRALLPTVEFRPAPSPTR